MNGLSNLTNFTNFIICNPHIHINYNGETYDGRISYVFFNKFKITVNNKQFDFMLGDLSATFSGIFMLEKCPISETGYATIVFAGDPFAEDEDEEELDNF